MSAGHSHAHPQDAGEQPSSPAARRLTLSLLIPAAVLTLVAMVLLWPHESTSVQAAPTDRVTGEVTAVHPIDCADDPAAQLPEGQTLPADAVCGTVSVRLTSGPESGKEISTAIPSGPGAITVATGDDIELLYLVDALDAPEGQPSYSISDHQRSTQLWIVGAAFALAVIAFGRWRGLTALLGLGVTFAVLLWFVVPAILQGRSPLLVAIAGSAAIMLTVKYLTQGFHVSTTVAVIGTLLALTITGVRSALTTAFTHLTGVADETSNYLNITHSNVNMQGLLLAGIVIGSLGVLDDVTVTQATAVTELARANPNYGYRQLYRAAERIGRAHIASVINTIVLAYAGASLPLMLLFADSNEPIGDTITSQLIAQELVRSAVGTLGLIAAVPITTALAALMARKAAAHPVQVSRPALAGAAHPVTQDVEGGGAGPMKDPWMAFMDRGDDQAT